MLKQKEVEKKIIIIGGGWYGCVIAWFIKKENPKYLVILVEANADIFSGISGTFGNRLHAGPHYPRSKETRERCHVGYNEFIEAFPELIKEHAYSLYCLGIEDAKGNPPKVTKEQFKAVCEEFNFVSEWPVDAQHPNVSYIADIKEPSIVSGAPLRNFFRKKLEEVGVEVGCNFPIKNIKQEDNGELILELEKEEGLLLNDETGKVIQFDYVINATSFKKFLPKSLDFKIFFQPCSGLIYQQNEPSEKGFSVTIMDGANPSFMPWNDGSEPRKYMFTHVTETLSEMRYATFKEAEIGLEKLEKDSERKRKDTENEVIKYFPEFLEKFKFVESTTTVILAKLDTPEKDDLRIPISFKELHRNVIHIFPGKVCLTVSEAKKVNLHIKGKTKDFCFTDNASYLKEDYPIVKKLSFKDSLSTPSREGVTEKLSKEQSGRVKEEALDYAGNLEYTNNFFRRVSKFQPQSARLTRSFRIPRTCSKQANLDSIESSDKVLSRRASVS